MDDHITVTDKYNLINLVREYPYPSKMLVKKAEGIDIPGLFNRDGNIDLTKINFDNILQDDFSNEVNETLGTEATPDLLSDKISIISHEYYAGTLEYLVYNE